MGPLHSEQHDATSWLQSLGLQVEQATLDGAFHRVDGKKKGRKAGWYKGWEEPVRNCIAGDWSTGQKWAWRVPGRVSANIDREIQRRQREAASSAREDLSRSVAATIREAISLAPFAEADHPYLVAKSVKPHRVHVVRGVLYVPNADVDGVVWGAQKITADGKKFWHKGQRVGGTFYQIGELANRAFICEGFATAASIYEISGTTTFCAFAASNLLPVARALKERHPHVEWTIAADNDRETEGNPGLRCGEEAAKAIGAHLVYPTFGTQWRGTDFNDLLLAEGHEVVAQQLEQRRIDMANVIGINRGAIWSGGELTRPQFFRLVVAKMNGWPDAPFDWPAFPRRFHYVADRTGRKAVLEELDGGIVAYRSRDVVADAILQYCWNSLNTIPEAWVDAEAGTKCRNMWLGLTNQLVERPSVLLEKSQPGLTFKRLDFDAPADPAATMPPNFGSLIARMSDPDAVCAFIGSLFDPEADRQQYLYLYGEGGDGKGALMRFLHAIFGDAAVSLSPPSKLGDKFWNFNIYGKRLGLFYDCEDWNWFGSSHFKSLTGGDPILFEEKGQSGFTDTPALKFIAASNSKPNVSSQAADMRRLIYVSCLSLPEDQRTPNFDRVLLGEAEGIVRSCRAIYQTRSSRHGAIMVDQALDVAWESESHYLDLFNTFFEVDPNSAVPGVTVSSKLREVGIKSSNEAAKIKKVWERVLGVRIKHTKKGAVYSGMGLLSKSAPKGDDRDDR